MSTINYEITTVARVKDRLGLSQTDATRDLVIKRLMYSATQFIEHACGGRRFKQQVIEDEIYDGNETSGKKDSILIIKNAPIDSSASVIVEHNAGTFQSPSWIDISQDITGIDYEAGIIYIRLPAGKQNVRVSYTGGYLIDFTDEFNDAKHTLPFDIADLADRLITRLMKKRESEGKKVEGFQTSQITWDDFIQDHDRTIIANYSRNQI